jgi:hypothetical protein
LLIGAVLVVLLALELTLRRWPTLLGITFANGAVSRYTTRPGGIYYFDPSAGMRFMIPNHNAVMLYNGYTWKHRTDALGFRNDPLHIPADVILLGDSVVYGHGVDFEHTFGQKLEERSGLRVANLGRTGDCAFQEAYILTAFVGLFKPRFVIHVFTVNDIDDLYEYLTDVAMEDFVARSVDQVAFPPMTDPERLLREREIRGRPLWKRANEDLYTMKMLRWLRQRAVAATPARRSRSADAATDPTSLGWRYTAHALAYMQHVASRGGAHFVMAPIADGRQIEILRDIAARHAIDWIDTRPLGPLHVAPSFLPNDGHLSPHGARVMADLTAAYINRLSPVGPSQVAR